MKFITALRFLTIIPLPRWRAVSQADVGPSLVYFPAVGLIIGLFLAGLSQVLLMVLPPPITSLLVLIALVLITGALHLDGLADTCDGLAGHTVEDRWRIMRDSHTGSFGVAGIVCLLLLKYVSLSTMPAQWLIPALVLMPMAGRWAMVYAISMYPYARPTGLGRAFKEQAHGKNLIIATFFTLGVAWLLIRWSGPVIMLAAWGIVTGLAVFFQRRFGGFTGDTYGAVNEITEAAVLLAMVLLNQKQWLLI